MNRCIVLDQILGKEGGYSKTLLLKRHAVSMDIRRTNQNEFIMCMTSISVPWSRQVYRPACGRTRRRTKRARALSWPYAPAATKGQEFLFDFLGNYSYNDYTQYVRTLRFWFCAVNVCLIDGQMPVSPPIISESQELVHHDLLLAPLFVALTKA
jgi:hypothetical protein